MLELLTDILSHQRLRPVFQPIVDMRNARIIGHEGLIRGPADSPLHAPAALFHAASNHGMADALERQCVLTVIEEFARLDPGGKLFLNLSPAGLRGGILEADAVLEVLRRKRLTRNRIIIEITESEPTNDFAPLIDAALQHRNAGFEIAMDDLGEGFSSLRLWSELRPHFVKVDKHFIRGIHQDPVKLQFVRSIQQIAENSASRVVAEGIETRADLMILLDLGIACGQGFFIGRPSAQPLPAIAPEAASCLAHTTISVYPQGGTGLLEKATADKLVLNAPTVSPKSRSETVLNLLLTQPQLHAIPVVENRIPIGIVNRSALVDRFSRIYTRELFGRRPCSIFMDSDPLIVDRHTSLEELSRLVVDKGKHSFSDGFILTDNGEYFGLGTGYDLMREISQMQINAARYANPLTLLPGNVPINEHMVRLIENKAAFAACHCDLDHFKPLNDMYGYRKGDEVIQASARIMADCCDPDRDFVGHVGGDDFIILFQSADWHERCQSMLDGFDTMVRQFFKPEHLAQGGYFGEDRRGNRVFFPLLALSIGAVCVEPGAFSNAHEISAVAAEAKKLAKRMEGSSLFVERRAPCPVNGELFPELGIASGGLD
jgi:EAL domain-containing protein (putative c-di-GMP-specific phosphodiesterase class I)/GGDEF domain-containing protein/predicted transcriptional regulator